MSDILLEIQDAPGEIYDIDWQSSLRGYLDWNPRTSLGAAVDWVVDTCNQEYTDALVDEVDEIKNEICPEEDDYEPTDDEMMGSFGTPWHDGL